MGKIVPESTVAAPLHSRAIDQKAKQICGYWKNLLASAGDFC
jgi:hypothetical protein